MAWPISFTSAGLMKVTIEGRIHGSVTNNVLWFVRPSELGTPDWPAILTALGTAVVACVVDNLLAGLSSQWTFEGVRVTLMSDAAKQEQFVAAPANSAGALAEALPATDAVVVSLKTPYKGKSYRGRFYVAGAPEANHAQSLISGTTLTQVTAFLTCLLTKFKYPSGTDTNRLVVFSRTMGYTAPSTYVGNANTTSPVTDGVVRNVLGTMRSRRVGRGS